MHIQKYTLFRFIDNNTLINVYHIILVFPFACYKKIYCQTDNEKGISKKEEKRNIEETISYSFKIESKPISHGTAQRTHKAIGECRQKTELHIIKRAQF